MKKGLSNIIAARANKHWLEELIDNFLMKKEDDDRGTHFHPSSVGKCSRLIQFSINKMVPSADKDPKGQRIFDNGHKMHERFGEYFEKMGILVEQEKSLSLEQDGVIIKGHADLVIKDDFDSLHLLELKSINSRGFEGLLVDNAPKPEHFSQWNIYAHCTGIYIGEIIYENKNDQSLKIFSVKYDPDNFNQSFSKFKQIYEYDKINKLVPVTSCNPRYCPAKSICEEYLKKK